MQLNFGSLESFISLISLELCVENPRNLMNDTKEISIEKEGRNKNNFQTFAKVILACFLYFLEIAENVTFK